MLARDRTGEISNIVLSFQPKWREAGKVAVRINESSTIALGTAVDHLHRLAETLASGYTGTHDGDG